MMLRPLIFLSASYYYAITILLCHDAATVMGWSIDTTYQQHYVGQRPKSRQYQLPSSSSQRQLDHNGNEDETTVFGTLHGFDSGGTDPMCWNTKMMNHKTSSSFSKNNTIFYEMMNITMPTDHNEMTQLTPNDTSIDEITDYMFNLSSSSDQSSTSLLPSCENGTTMEIIIVGTPDFNILTETHYTFQVTVRMDMSKVVNDATTLQLPTHPNDPNVTVCYIRLLLCDALRTGFCNPLRDTRAIDEHISMDKTNMRMDMSQMNYNDSEKFLFSEEDDILIGILDGPFIYTRWIAWPLMPTDDDNNSTIYTSSVNITVCIPKGASPGTYFFVGHAAVALFENNTSNIQRLDIAAALPDNVVGVSDPPTILYVTKSTTIVLGIAIGIFGSIALIMLCYTIYHLDHIVIRLAQGYFLAALIAVCLFQIVFAFTVLPTKESYCVLKNIFYLIPQTIIGAILVARMWRAYCIIHAAQRIGGGNIIKSKTDFVEAIFVKTLTYIADPISLLPYHNKSHSIKQSGIRSQIPSRYSVTLILMLSFPQILVQMIITFYYPIGLSIMYNSDETIGRYVCDIGNSWSEIFGLVYAIMIYLVAVVMAWISRALPSAFNEKDEVFHVAMMSAMLVVVDLVLSERMDQPTTQPDVMVLLQSVLIICNSTVVLKSMVWPKLIRVYRGEKVVMGAIFQSRFTLGNSSTVSQQFHHTENATTTTVHGGPSIIRHDEEEDDENDGTYGNGVVGKEQATTTVTTDGDAASDDALPSLPETAPDTTTTNHQPHPRRYVIREGEPLPPSLEKQIHQVQMLLRDVSTQMCDGRAITTKEFLLLKEKIAKLQDSLVRVDMENDSSLNTE